MRRLWRRPLLDLGPVGSAVRAFVEPMIHAEIQRLRIRRIYRDRANQIHRQAVHQTLPACNGIGRFENRGRFVFTLKSIDHRQSRYAISGQVSRTGRIYSQSPQGGVRPGKWQQGRINKRYAICAELSHKRACRFQAVAWKWSQLGEVGRTRRARKVHAARRVESHARK